MSYPHLMESLKPFFSAPSFNDGNKKRVKKIVDDYVDDVYAQVPAVADSEIFATCVHIGKDLSQPPPPNVARVLDFALLELMADRIMNRPANPA